MWIPTQKLKRVHSISLAVADQNYEGASQKILPPFRKKGGFEAFDDFFIKQVFCKFLCSIYNIL